MNELQAFFEKIEELKHKEREGWRKNGVDRPRDTIASHSFGAALIGWIMAEEEGLDSDRIVKMLLLHDLIMAYIDDYTPEDKEFEDKKEIEMEASERMFKDVPDSVEDEMREMFDELQEMESEEAVFVNDCDKLDTLLQASSYLSDEELDEFIEFYRDEISTETGKEVFEDIVEEKDSSE